MNAKHDERKEKPEDLLEVLGWSCEDDFNVVVWSSRDGEWIDAKSQSPIKVRYWWNLPETPRKTK